jgi:hypothetical protein
LPQNASVNVILETERDGRISVDIKIPTKITTGKLK